MDLLRSKSVRIRLSEAFYVVFNVLLPIAVLLLVRGFDPPYLAIALVLLSKWRIFALRPRFWWASIKANLVDIQVGLSTVGLMYLAASNTTVQVVVALAYGAWLLALKPRSDTRSIMLQAGVAQFLSIVVLFSFSAIFNELLVVAGCGIVGYIAARHIISNYEEKYTELWSSIWGLLIVQLAWLMFRWTTVYNLGLPIVIPQVSLIVLVMGFCAARMFNLSKEGKLSRSVLRGTVIFGSLLLAVIILFSPWDVTV